MVKIVIQYGYEVLVDKKDIPTVLFKSKKYPYRKTHFLKWFPKFSRNGDPVYAVCHVKSPHGWKTIRMHRLILGIKKNQRVDHKNGNGLDNRRKNLRIISQQQNCFNSKAKKTAYTTSIYKGVYRRRDNKKWCAGIMFNRKTIYLGSFEKEVDAAIAYNRAAKRYFKQFAKLNKT